MNYSIKDMYISRRSEQKIETLTQIVGVAVWVVLPEFFAYFIIQNFRFPELALSFLLPFFVNSFS